MRALLVAIAVVAIVVGAALWFAPASLVDRHLAEASGGQVRIAEATGTLARGRGMLGDSRGVWRMPIEWRIDAASLARGEIDVAVTGRPPGAVVGRVALNDSRSTLHDFSLTMPAAAAMSIAGAEGAAGGDLVLQTASLVLENGRASGSLQARWQQARAGVPGAVIVDFGTVTLRLAPTARGMAGPLEARGGDIVASGNVEIDEQALRVDIEVTPSAHATDAVRAALALLGRPDSRGTVRVAVSRPL